MPQSLSEDTRRSDGFQRGEPDRCVVRVRHPLECLPFRPEVRPAWSPSRRRQTRKIEYQADPPAYRQPKLIADPDLGAVRINFRYASFQPMMAAHSEKAHRDQFFEGAHETYSFRLHEIDPNYSDLQYQALALAWSSRAGVAHRFTLDYGVETYDGRLIFGEIKASADYFDDPHLSERLDFVESFLAKQGALLERRVAGGLPDHFSRRLVKNIYDARRTRFDAALAERVQAHIRTRGGTSSLGLVLQEIGGPPTIALEIARAMMHRRILSMPILSPPMSDVPVSIPAPASKGLLRTFLKRCVTDEGMR